MNTAKFIWIDAGYTAFARLGPEAIRVDSLAKILNRSRSGYYTAFNDSSTFLSALFDRHIVMANAMAAELTPNTRFHPEFVDISAKYKDYIFFHKQLYFLRNKAPMYAEAFDKAKSITERKILLIWKRSAGLQDVPEEKLLSFYEVIRDSLFTKLDYNSFTAESYKKLLEEANLSFHFLLT